MRTAQMIVGSMVVGMLAAACLMSGSATGKAESTIPLKIGVVNLEKVMEVYPTRLTLEKSWQEQKENSSKKLEGLAKELETMSKELEALDPKSDEAKNKRMAMAEKQASLQVRKAVAEQELVQRYKNALEVIYNDILNDVEEFRKQAGYDLIIEFYREPMKSTTLDQLQMQMMRKVVLASNQTLDVTDKVIAYVSGETKTQ